MPKHNTHNYYYILLEFGIKRLCRHCDSCDFVWIKPSEQKRLFYKYWKEEKENE